MKHCCLRLCIENDGVIESSQDIDQDSIVWPLVERSPSDAMIFVELFSNQFKDLTHEFMLVEVELAQQKHQQFDAAVNVAEVDQITR